MSEHNRLRIAEHEAAHAVAAMEMGLRVAWVSIEQVASEGDIFMAATGIEIDGDESDEMKLAINASIPERDLLGVCVSMAMASYVAPAGTWIDRYSRIERRQAITMAKRGGIDADEVMHRCEVIKDEKWEEIISLSRRLVDEGRVEFGVAA